MRRHLLEGSVAIRAAERAAMAAPPPSARGRAPPPVCATSSLAWAAGTASIEVASVAALVSLSEVCRKALCCLSALALVRQGQLCWVDSGISAICWLCSILLCSILGKSLLHFMKLQN